MSLQKLNEETINSTHEYISEFMGQEGGEVIFQSSFTIFPTHSALCD